MQVEDEKVIQEEAVDFGLIFEGTELSEEVKEKIKTVFESAVSVKVSAKVAAITEEFETKFDEELDSVKTELTEKIDSFLNYAVNEWVEENKLELETGMKNEITENFIVGLKTLFQESYIDVPEEKYDVLGEMEDKVEVLEDKLNEQLEKNISLSSKVSALVKESIIVEATKGLTDIDSDKLKALTEGVEFDTEATFKEKIQTIKENYFPKQAVKPHALTEELHVNEKGEPVEIPAHMKRYMDALARV